MRQIRSSSLTARGSACLPQAPGGLSRAEEAEGGRESHLADQVAATCTTRMTGANCHRARPPSRFCAHSGVGAALDHAAAAERSTYQPRIEPDASGDSLSPMGPVVLP
jgi:hypothetical protein